MRVDNNLIKQFYEWLLTQGSEDTAKSYCATLITYCQNKNIKDVNKKEFFFWLAEEIRERGWGLNTIARHTFAAKKFLEFLNLHYETKIIDLQMIKCRKSPQKPIIYLEKTELEAIRKLPIRNYFDLRNRTLFEFLINTGCRISEALNIKRQETTDKKELKVLGKGGKERIVFLNGAMEWLKKYLKKAEGEFLFLSQQGNKLKRSDACRIIRTLGENAGIQKKITPHVLRKTWITYLIWAGIDPKTVQAMAGHSDIQTTLKFYTAISYDKMRDASRVVERALNGGCGKLGLTKCLRS